MKKFLQVAGGFIGAAVLTTVDPSSLINVGGCMVAKHTGMMGDKVDGKLGNDRIPYANMAITTAISYVKAAITTGDWVAPIIPALQAGGVATAMSTGIHQFLKLPLRNAVTGNMAAKVGPGPKFSL